MRGMRWGRQAERVREGGESCARRAEGVVWEGGQVLGEGFGRKKREEIKANTNCQSET